MATHLSRTFWAWPPFAKGTSPLLSALPGVDSPPGPIAWLLADLIYLLASFSACTHHLHLHLLNHLIGYANPLLVGSLGGICLPVSNSSQLGRPTPLLLAFNLFTCISSSMWALRTSQNESLLGRTTRWSERAGCHQDGHLHLYAGNEVASAPNSNSMPAGPAELHRCILVWSSKCRTSFCGSKWCG